MANLTSQLVRLSFEGIGFPYKEITIDGEARHHVHEYPHSPGGALEKLGRKLYAFNIESSFHGDFLPERYRKLWPQNLGRLVTLFEQETTGNLVLPQIGAPIRAMCTNWKRVLKAINTSGESVTLKFLEDSENLRLSTSTILARANGINQANTALVEKYQAQPRKIGLLDAILRTVNDVLALRDQFDMYSHLLEVKLLSIFSMMGQLLETEQYLAHPDRWELVDALHEVWSQCRTLYADQQQKGLTTKVFVTRSTMTTSEVAFAIYGTSSRAADLLRLNIIDDPLLIPPRTTIRYYAD